MKKIMRAIKPKCGIERCNRPHYAKGYCQAHYNRAWDTRLKTFNKNPTIGRSNFKKGPRGKCTLKGCSRPHYANSLCQMHYNTMRSVIIVHNDERKCSVKGCHFKHAANNFCKFHYDLSRAQGEFLNIKTMSNYDEEAS